MISQGFADLPVVFFESRRAPEMASLVERHGGTPVPAPALREVRSAAGPETVAFAERLDAGGFDLVVFLTGVGTRALAEEVAPTLSREAFASALGRTRVVARGPKPVAALRELGVSNFVAVPSPNTYREVLEGIDASFGAGGLAGKSVAVQEYGGPSEELHAGLLARGAIVTSVRVYTWALPEDIRPLRRGLERVASGEVKIALFTSRAQVEHALLVAAEMGIEAEVRAALSKGVVASIGPVCSEALRAEDLAPDVEPEHPKMGHLVKEAAERSRAILAAKASAIAGATAVR